MNKNKIMQIGVVISICGLIITFVGFYILKSNKKLNYTKAVENYENGDFDAAISYFEKSDIDLDSEKMYFECKCLQAVQGIRYQSDDYNDNFTIISGKEYKAQNTSIQLGLFNEPFEYQITYIDENELTIKGNVEGEEREYNYLYTIESDTFKYYDEFGDCVNIKKRITENEYKALLSKIDEKVSEEPYVGMSREKLSNSTWGKPKDINKTTTKYGVSEQWVYSNYRYVYLEEGIVTEIQE